MCHFLPNVDVRARPADEKENEGAKEQAERAVAPSRLVGLEEIPDSPTVPLPTLYREGRPLVGYEVDALSALWMMMQYHDREYAEILQSAIDKAEDDGQISVSPQGRIQYLPILGDEWKG